MYSEYFSLFHDIDINIVSKIIKFGGNMFTGLMRRGLEQSIISRALFVALNIILEMYLHKRPYAQGDIFSPKMYLSYHHQFMGLIKNLFIANTSSFLIIVHITQLILEIVVTKETDNDLYIYGGNCLTILLLKYHGCWYHRSLDHHGNISLRVSLDKISFPTTDVLTTESQKIFTCRDSTAVVTYAKCVVKLE